MDSAAVKDKDEFERAKCALWSAFKYWLLFFHKDSPNWNSHKKPYSYEIEAHCETAANLGVQVFALHARREAFW